MKALFPLLLCLAALSPAPAGQDANRHLHVTRADPYYPSLKLARFITPQWIGEPGVEAVVIIAIDDLRQPEKYESYLRPILERLKRIDGRAPASVFCNELTPTDPQFQTWLAEG